MVGNYSFKIIAQLSKFPSIRGEQEREFRLGITTTEKAWHGLVLWFFWTVIAAIAAYIKGEEWKPGGNENCFSDTYPIQEVSYWGIGSSLAVMEIVRNILQELKINHQSLNIKQSSEDQKDAHTSVYGEQKGKVLTGNRDLTLKILLIVFIGACLPRLPDT